MSRKEGRTRDTPNVSHFASDLGKTGKSTARMDKHVINIICALYVDKAGNGETLILELGQVGLLELRLEFSSRMSME
jgi:hypothetical protein